MHAKHLTRGAFVLAAFLICSCGKCVNDIRNDVKKQPVQAYEFFADFFPADINVSNKIECGSEGLNTHNVNFAGTKRSSDGAICAFYYCKSEGRKAYALIQDSDWYACVFIGNTPKTKRYRFDTVGICSAFVVGQSYGVLAHKQTKVDFSVQAAIAKMLHMRAECKGVIPKVLKGQLP